MAITYGSAMGGDLAGGARRSRRNILLGLAAATLGVGYLLGHAGYALIAATSLLVCSAFLVSALVAPFPAPGTGWKWATYFTLDSLKGAAMVAAPLLALVGFALSRHSLIIRTDED